MDFFAFLVTFGQQLRFVMLKISQLSKSYANSRSVLHKLDYQLDAGRFVAVMGESGVGKSTLLNLIAGLDRADSGQVWLDGVDLCALDETAATLLRRNKMGFIFQAFHILPHLNLLQNVSVPLLLNGHGLVRAEQMLQAVGLARALVHRPSLLLADEPTGNLDPETAKQILMLLRSEIKASGASAIMVTHSHAAAAMADQVLILSQNGLHAV
jgi:putative ABC transport system ATP-binding protein